MQPNREKKNTAIFYQSYNELVYTELRTKMNTFEDLFAAIQVELERHRLHQEKQWKIISDMISLKDEVATHSSAENHTVIDPIVTENKCLLEKSSTLPAPSKENFNEKAEIHSSEVICTLPVNENAMYDVGAQMCEVNQEGLIQKMVAQRFEPPKRKKLSLLEYLTLPKSLFLREKKKVHRIKFNLRKKRVFSCKVYGLNAKKSSEVQVRKKREIFSLSLFKSTGIGKTTFGYQNRMQLNWFSRKKVIHKISHQSNCTQPIADEDHGPGMPVVPYAA